VIELADCGPSLEPSDSLPLYPLSVRFPVVKVCVRETVTYLVTHSMVQDILSKAGSHLACQTVAWCLYGN
jgi:hypothetical protein